MRGWHRALAAVLSVVAIGVAVTGWADPRPDITADQAVAATGEALARAELTARIDPRPMSDIYRSRTQPAVAVWRVRATLDAGPIELYLARAGAQPVAIDDRTPDRTEYLLSASQYGAVASGIEDPALGLAVQRRVALTLGALLVVAVALTAALLVDPQDRR